MRSRVRRLVALPLLAALEACGGGKSPLPEPPIAPGLFAGGSADDVWAISWEQELAHWDGEDWAIASEGGPPAPRGSPAALAVTDTLDQRRQGELVLAPGVLLAVDADGVFALDRNGEAVEDFGIPAELVGTEFGWKQVITNGVAHFGSAVVQDDGAAVHYLFRYQDGAWADLQAPLEVSDFRVSPDGRVIAQTPLGFAPTKIYLLYADGVWTEIEHGPDALPFFVGDTVASPRASANDSAQEVTIGVEWLDGTTWTSTAVEAGTYGGNEIWLEFKAVSVGGSPAVRYARRRVSGSNRFIEYGYLTLKDDLSFGRRSPIVESDNVCSTACLADYEDRTTQIWTMADGSSVYTISAKPGDDGAGNAYFVIDGP